MISLTFLIEGRRVTVKFWIDRPQFTHSAILVCRCKLAARVERESGDLFSSEGAHRENGADGARVRKMCGEGCDADPPGRRPRAEPGYSSSRLLSSMDRRMSTAAAVRNARAGRRGRPMIVVDGSRAARPEEEMRSVSDWSRS